jgi:hypothetical protein
MDSVLDALDIVANIIEVFTFIIVVLLFWQARRAFRRYLSARAVEKSERPWAVAIGIGDDITGQVMPNLDELDLKGIPLESYTRRGHLPPDQFYEVLHDMLRLKTRLSQAGATEIHLFYRGPVTLAMGIGSIFDNWVPVKVYEHAQGKYRLDFVLEKGSVLGLLGTGPGSTIDDAFGL